MIRNILRSALAVAAMLLLAQCSSGSSGSSVGCPASPENPTVLLTLLGGVVALPLWVRGLRRRK